LVSVSRIAEDDVETADVQVASDGAADNVPTAEPSDANGSAAEGDEDTGE
jgi:hypothetical protein